MQRTLDKELEDLRNEYNENQTKLGKLTKDKEILKTDITSLEKIISDIEQIVSAYSQPYSNIIKEMKDTETYSQEMKLKNENTIKNKKVAIEKKITGFDEQIKKKEEEVNKYRKEFEDANVQFEDTQKNLVEKQIIYDSLKHFQIETENKLKELKNLKELIDNYDKRKETAKMWFLLLELDNLLGEINNIKTPEDLRSELNKKWKEWKSAKITLREKEDERNFSKNEFEAKLNDLDSLRKNRRNEILKVVS